MIAERPAKRIAEIGDPIRDEGVAYLGGSPTFKEQGSVEDGNALQDAINNQPPVAPGATGIGLGAVTPRTLSPGDMADRRARDEYNNQLRAGGDAFFAAFPDAPQPPQVGTADITFYVDPITGEQKQGSSTDIRYRNSLKRYLDENPAAMASYQQNVLSVEKPASMQGPTTPAVAGITTLPNTGIMPRPSPIEPIDVGSPAVTPACLLYTSDAADE